VTDDPQAFRWHRGAPWLDLLATSGLTFGPRPIERIPTPGRLAAWLDGAGLAPERPPGTADVERARQLRETLRALAMASVAGEAPPADAVAHLAAVLSEHHDPVRLEVEGGELRRRRPGSTAEALARLARQAADHLTGPLRHELAVCGETDCRGVFADPTGRRHWCPAAGCASRGRVRALRARRAAAQQG
jgi:predicted RNA-binding Zn ribbon-like protein